MKICNNEPAWINPKLKSSIRQRQKALAKGNQAQFKKLRNQVNRRSKRNAEVFSSAPKWVNQNIPNQISGGNRRSLFAVWTLSHPPTILTTCWVQPKLIPPTAILCLLWPIPSTKHFWQRWRRFSPWLLSQVHLKILHCLFPPIPL